MKLLKLYIVLTAVLSGFVLLQACKTKMAAQKTSSHDKNIQPVYYASLTMAPPVADTAADYNFNNIQFGYNSATIKTEFYPVLAKTAVEMMKDPSVKFNINGYTSKEGTDEHSMVLAQARCNSIKDFLVNSGVNADNLIIRGYGEGDLFAGNGVDSAAWLNRRVEIKVLLPGTNLSDLNNTKNIVIEP